MALRYPFPQKFALTCSAKCHTSKDSGIAADYATWWGSAVDAVTDGKYRKHSQTFNFLGEKVTNLYIQFVQGEEIDLGFVILPKGTKWDFVHVGSVRAESAWIPVKAGQQMGTTGNSGAVLPRPTKANPYAGSHTHINIYLPGSKVPLDPEPIMEKIWQLAHPTVKTNPMTKEIEALQKQLAEQDKKAAAEKAAIVAKAQEQIAAAELEVQVTQDQLAVARQELIEAQSRADALKSFAGRELGIDLPGLLTEFIEEGGAPDRVMGKWETFVDSKIPAEQTRLRSTLKYDIFVMIGYFVSMPTVGTWLLSSGFAQRVVDILTPFRIWIFQPFANISAVGVTATTLLILSVLFKLLLTKYDKNKDGKLDIEDTEVFKDFIVVRPE